MSNLRDAIESYVKRVKELSDHVRGNEQATKQSLIGPFFTMLGYDLTDPRECIPEYKTDFGKDRSAKPIDWAFKHTGASAFFVEAKEVGKKLAGYDEQLADYFAKDPNVKLGILTNGAQWRFFTDVVNPNVMDKEPFAKWDIAADEPPPFDVITLLEKSKFSPELIRTFAQKQRTQNLLIGELNRLLEPAPEFTKLAVANIETRNLVQAVVESWKPIVANALQEWARQHRLSVALTSDDPPKDASDAKDDTAGKVETTAEELSAFELVKTMLGRDRPVAYEDAVAYFKIHVAERRNWVFVRLYMNRRNPILAVPIPREQVESLAANRPIATLNGWTAVTLESPEDIGQLKALIEAAFDSVKLAKTA